MARTVTLLLQDWKRGDASALEELMPLVYAELHKLAASYLGRERPGHTLRPTELVSEAYLKLVGNAPEVENRTHFYGIAARTMRQVLVDHARKRATGKRGANDKPVTLDDQIAAADRPDQLLALDEALDALAAFDERKARAIELRYFGGLEQAEIAEVLGIHVNTVARDLKFAEAWLQRQMKT